MLPLTNHVINNINHLYQNEFLFDDDNFKIPVCIICDSIVPKNKQCYIDQQALISMKRHLKPQRNLPNSLECFYKYTGDGAVPSIFKDMLLSPNGFYKKEKEAFLVCKSCQIATSKMYYPTKP